MRKPVKRRGGATMIVCLGITVILWWVAPRIGYYLIHLHPEEGIAGAAIIFGIIAVPILVTSMIFAAITLYALSRAFPLLYGLIEVIAGVIYIEYTFTMYLDALTGGEALGPANDFHPVFSAGLQIAIALYVLVVGLQDASAALPQGTRIRQYWDKIFPSEETY